MKKVEISMKEILVYVLRRWKLIAAISIALAILVGGYTYTRSENRTVDSDKMEVKLSVLIDLVDFSADGLNAQTENSARNDRSNKLRDRYLLIAQAAPLKEILKGIAPQAASEEELREYVFVDSPATGILTIDIKPFDDMNTKAAAEAMHNYLNSFAADLGKSVSLNTLSFLSLYEGTVQHGSSGLLKSAAIGLVIGLVLSTLFFALVYVVSLPIQLPEQIQRHLGIRYLGGFSRKKHFSLADKVAGNLRMSQDPQAIDLICANLQAFIDNHKNILVTGTVSQQLIKDFEQVASARFESHSLNFSSSMNINEEANAAIALQKSDAVILIERLDQSKLKKINDQIERIEMSGKEILGYVLI